ncbi:MAG: hypothetical protein M1830_005813 [Pleopsidium flavum]|nr:MAG: hypothetical protein M1830_005813 [Pleopsidium flavum]
MFRILESQAPAKQTATDTISTLSSRLQSATLLEDRRAAILGLRSFAKAYPASVASGALRGLISSLNNDAGDVDTIKVVLETLLMLFNPHETSPEASDDIALWLADEFTQRQDNITVLLDLLDTPDFYSRLYALQLISAISSARPERTQECVFVAPLGISRLVAILEDRREPVRSEGLVLLTLLTPSSPELQKLVAFENAFDRVFALIDAEGSLTHGGIVVQDCLSLLANLLRLNVSNQSFFRETGCVTKLAKLLGEAVKEQESADGVAEWAKSQRDKNLWGLLAVLRLFLVDGGLGTQANQIAFWQSGVLVQVLQLAFTRALDVTIRAEALTTCADMIRGHATIQEGFAQLEVPFSRLDPAIKQLSGSAETNGIQKVNVIHCLLDLVLASTSSHEFDARLSACECIKAYFFKHVPIRMHFLRRAIEGHVSGEDDVVNILTTLIDDSDVKRSTDPYRPWLAAVLLFHLIYEDPQAKSLAMSVTEGDAEHGEEVITCIQAIAGNLIDGLQKGDDERVSVGYLMLLCGWLFEDPDAVNDFLGEGSSIESLIQTVAQSSMDKVIVPGLCAILLGIIYEFSTKDSPVPRATLHSILASRLSRDRYVDKITKLREHHLVRDFEVLPQRLVSDQGGAIPDVYFDKTFIHFLKDNFSRLIRAIDRDPGMEIAVMANGVQKGISRELVDSLRGQLDDRNQALQKAESDLLSLERRLGQEQADHRRAKESASVELSRIKSVNQGLQNHHEDDLHRLHSEHKAAADSMQRRYEGDMQAIQIQLQELRRNTDEDAVKVRDRNEAEVKDLKSTVQKLEIDLEKASKDHMQDLQTAHEEYCTQLNALQSRLERAEGKAEEADARAKRAAEEIQDAKSRASKADDDLMVKEQARKAAQSELDDLLMVLGDLEEKRAKDKKRLKALGEQVSDAEDEGNGESDEDEREKATA